MAILALRSGTTGERFGLSLSGTKSSIGTSSFFGGTDGKVLTTPTFKLGDGGLTRTNTEFLNESRRTLGDLRANRARFGGGFTDFRRARLQEVENARARTVGNLRSQLGRRGILGASFAQDALTRTELDFQQQADKVAAEIDVQEFEFNLKNLEQESQIVQANLSRELTEFNIAAQFISNLNSFETRRFEAELELAAARLRARSGGISFGRSFSRFGPGGPLGSFGSSQSGSGFTGTTATSGSIVGFDSGFNIKSGFTGPAPTLPSTA